MTDGWSRTPLSTGSYEVTQTIAGLHMHDPRTGIRFHVVRADEAEGRDFVLEYRVPVGGPREVVMPHWHEDWTERFEILAGNARYRVGRTEGELQAGASIELGPGTVHLHPWNVGDTELRVRQTTTLGRPDPAAVRDTLHSFAMLFWLSRQGKVDSRGLPNPLQASLILQALQRHRGYLPGIPVLVQRALIGGLAAVARRRGYAAFDPACLDDPTP
jgi:quercetin dioxygenase-like cupin family protein